MKVGVQCWKYQTASLGTVPFFPEKIIFIHDGLAIVEIWHDRRMVVQFKKDIWLGEMFNKIPSITTPGSFLQFTCVSKYELSGVRVVLGTSCLGYELSWVRVVLDTGCLGYELSRSRELRVFQGMIDMVKIWQSICTSSFSKWHDGGQSQPNNRHLAQFF